MRNRSAHVFFVTPVIRPVPVPVPVPVTVPVTVPVPFTIHVLSSLNNLFLFLLDFFSSSVTIFCERRRRRRRRRRQKCFPAPRLSRVPSFRAAGQNAREDARREDGLSSRTRRKIRGRKNARRREDGR